MLSQSAVVKSFAGIFAFVLFVILLFFFSSPPWNATTFPNPQKDFVDCQMPNSSYICDPNQLLFDSARIKIAAKLEELEKKTQKIYEKESCKSKGVIVSMALLYHLKEDLQNFTETTFQKWNLDPVCQKWILIAYESRLNEEKGTFAMKFGENVPISSCGYWKLLNQYKSEFERRIYSLESSLTELLNGISKQLIRKEDKETTCSKLEAWFHASKEGLLVGGLIIVIFIVIALICFWCHGA